MNLIDFTVTEIISEERDVMYKLMNYTEEDVDEFNNDDDAWWYNYLHSNGCKQIYKYYDDGGYNINTKYFNLDVGHTPYVVGYRGAH
jgi:hypothetical protein